MGVPSSLPSLASAPAGERQSALLPILHRVVEWRWSQAFLALPPHRRLVFLRACAAGCGALVLVLLLLLLWPRSVFIVVRSEPEHAEVVRDGQALGTTPFTIELRKGSTIKVVLRKAGYVDAPQEVRGGGEKSVLVTLAAQPPKEPEKPAAAAAPPVSDDTAKPESGDDDKKEGKKKKKRRKKKTAAF